MSIDLPAPSTLRSAAGLAMTPPSLADAALLVIDAQLEYAPDGRLALPGVTSALDRIEKLITRARQVGGTVIHVVHHGKPGALFDPSNGGQILGGAEPIPGEKIITKTLPNAFAGSDLADHLQTINTPPLVIAGFMTHMCVSSTARAALDLGLVTSVVTDATATRSLPAGDSVISAVDLQRASLAALADRFSILTSTAALTD